ncbi:MAG: hypothetical protein ACI87A_000153 [Planctomycetota bacterium]|jgi:hypothetical protein
MVSLVLVAMAGLSLSLLVITDSSSKELRESRERVSAMYVAEAGISQAIFSLETGGTGVIGSEGTPFGYEQSQVWVDVTDVGGGSKSLVATGVDRGSAYRIEVLVDKEESNSLIWAAFGDVGMTMNSNAHVDSYNSTLGLYEDQDVNGSGSDTYAADNGNIGSNADIELSANSTVHGDGQPGPTGSASVSGSNASISGATAPSTAVIPLPALVIPSFPSSGDYFASGNSNTLASGNYNFGEFELGGNSELMIHGPATIVVTNMTIKANAELFVDASGGPVEFFVLDDFVMNSNTVIASTTYSPADIKINLESDNVIDPDVSVDLDEVDFDSNAQYYGVIYAPNASVEINSNFELFGSLVAYKVHLDSNSQVHFDEALLTSSSSASDSYSMSLWRGAPYSVGSKTNWLSTSSVSTNGSDTNPDGY